MRPRQVSKKILFIRLDSKYGDSIVSQFALEKIKKELNSKIYVLTKNKNSIDLFSRIVDCFIICKNPRRMIQLYKSYKELSGIRFDYVIHLDKNIKDRELILLRYIKATSVITADTRVKFATKYLIQKGEVIHARKRYINLLNAMNIQTNGNESTQLKIPDTYVKKLSQLTEKIGKIIYFNPYGSGSQRKLSAIKIDEIKNNIKKTFPRHSILIQSKEHRELSIKNIDDNVYIFETNAFNDILAIIGISVFVVSVDTATSHAATALGKSSIVFYLENKENYIEWNADSDRSLPIFSKRKKGRVLSDINNFSNDELSDSLIKIKDTIN
jgi:ADP-heptose:LPS heptosyltransferase